MKPDQIDESRLIDIAREGRLAQDLAADPTLLRFFAQIEGAIVEGLRRASPDDYDQVRDLLYLQRAHERYRSMFDRHMRAGRVAETKLSKLRAAYDKFISGARRTA